MNIFYRKITAKQIERFSHMLVETLQPEMPQLIKALALTKVQGINFMHNPPAIHISLSHSQSDYEIINRNHKTYFHLKGISVFNKVKKCYQPLQLYYQSDCLTRIFVEDPKYFHKTFNFDKIEKNSLVLEHLDIINPDKKIVTKILKSLTKEQIELLELEYTFEIEVDAQLFYTILDMEDGNYIAVNQTGKIFKLNHDAKERVKLIANTPIDFFQIYKGQKNVLETIIQQ